MKFVIDDEKNLIRLDKYLTSNTDISRSKISEMIKEGLVLVNGKQTKSSYILRLNDNIEITGTLKIETNAKAEDIPLLDTDLSKVKANAYDIILNGYELGGGSLRIHDNQLQKKIFEILGLSDEEIRNKFGFFIDAFQYGTPPHGGLAFGLDRIAMILSESDSIRDVIAFPKNASASDPMSKAPSNVDPKQLEELHIAITK